MGNLNSKATVEENESFNNIELDSNNVDPRSPSLSIQRTPIQHSLIATNSKVTKNVDLTKQCFGKYDDVPINPTLRKIMNEFDPRSPTLDFERTPLAFLLKDPEWVSAHNNSNTSIILDASLDSTNQLKDLEPKNLCDELANLSVQTEYSQPIENETERSNTTDENGDELCKEEQPDNEDQHAVGLLETNFDYLETDVDIVRRQKYKEFNEKAKHISSETKVEVIETKIEGETLVQNVVQNVISEDIAYKDCSDKDPRSPSDGIDRTPILIVEKETVISESNKMKSSKKINSRVKEVLKNNAMLQRNFAFQDMFKENDVKTIANDALLIYEDVVENVIPVSTSKINPAIQNTTEGSRTPLACMINIDKALTGSSNNTPVETVTKSSHAKSKIPVRVSKISPIYSEKCDVKNIKSRRILSNDLENTPPKPRKACWDRDSSVIL